MYVLHKSINKYKSLLRNNYQALILISENGAGDNNTVGKELALHLMDPSSNHRTKCGSFIIN